MNEQIDPKDLETVERVRLIDEVIEITTRAADIPLVMTLELPEARRLQTALAKALGDE